MPNRDIVAIGVSAGGVSALLSLVRELPQDLPATVIVTLHLAAEFKTELDGVLSRAGSPPAKFALAVASRTLQEQRAPTERLHRHVMERGHSRTATQWAEQAETYRSELEVIRRAIERLHHAERATDESRHDALA